MDGLEDMNDDITGKLIIGGITSFTGNAAKNSSGGEGQRPTPCMQEDMRVLCLFVPNGLTHTGKET